MFAEPVYTFNEEDGLGIIELVKSASVSQPFTVRVFGGKKNIPPSLPPSLPLSLHSPPLPSLPPSLPPSPTK